MTLRQDHLAEQRRILAVDDEEEILRLYNTFLKFKGYQIKSVSNAEECIDFLIANKVDVILLDVNMPGIDGLRLLEMIRSNPQCKETPIIIISARGDEATVKQAALLGCDNFIVKPFRLNELAERIHGELYSIGYEQVQTLLESARDVRTRLMRDPGLQDFRIVDWDPYYIRQEGIEFCILVPRGVRPTGLAKIPADELCKKIFVFYRHPIRWKRAWPAA